jgi:CTP synthase
MKVLFIDDDPASIKPAMEKLIENNFSCRTTNFSEHKKTLENYKPDIIILDMMEGTPANDPEGKAGKEYFKSIWNIHFCPLVVYSADPTLMTETHPLVATVKKGKDSEIRLLGEANKLRPIAEGMVAISTEINSTLRKTLRDVAPYVYECKDIENQEKTIQYLGRRRIAALLDTKPDKDQSLHPIEQYILPPISISPETGDLIRHIIENSNKPESYLLIVTPSCDLVAESGRKPKVDKVLCAHCESNEILWQKGGIKKEKDSLISFLSVGFKECYCFIPGIPNKIPSMVANMKNLELIPFENIVNLIDVKEDNTKKYIRVASIDSPFRENISWAYMNTACRPGMPDRNRDIWAKQILG